MDYSELQDIAGRLIAKKDVPVRNQQQAVSDAAAGFFLCSYYGKKPTLQDMDGKGFGLAPLDDSGRRGFVVLKPKAPFYVKDSLLDDKYDFLVFVTEAHTVYNLEGWMPTSQVHSCPRKEFVNGSSYSVDKGLMLPMPDVFDFDPGCDILECSEPAIYINTEDVWDCVMCDKVRRCLTI